MCIRDRSWTAPERQVASPLSSDLRGAELQRASGSHCDVPGDSVFGHFLPYLVGDGSIELGPAADLDCITGYSPAIVRRRRA
eukprot:2390076-Alexandrium_andersonii.AAC.1